tara:strand:+ start:152 stop:943 length:792 start_codon:yes stop_codon:yes gene_type:complete
LRKLLSIGSHSKSEQAIDIKTTKSMLLAALALQTMAQTMAIAETARLTSMFGTEVNIASGEFAEILNSPGKVFSAEDMAHVDSTLQAQGLTTSGHISIMLAETGAGLSLITLMDGVDTPTPPGEETRVGMTSFVPTTSTWQYNIDAGGTFDSFPIGDQVVLSGAFLWDSGVNNEVFAISNLADLDVGTLVLNSILSGGLTPNQTIQILTSNAGNWSVAATFDFEATKDNKTLMQYFDFEITAIPAPATLCMLALAGTGRRRRR